MDIEIIRFGVLVDGTVISRKAAEHAAEELRQRGTLKVDGIERKIKSIQIHYDEHDPSKGVVVASVYMPQHPLGVHVHGSETGWIELFAQGKGAGIEG